MCIRCSYMESVGGLNTVLVYFRGYVCDVWALSVKAWPESRIPCIHRSKYTTNDEDSGFQIGICYHGSGQVLLI